MPAAAFSFSMEMFLYESPRDKEQSSELSLWVPKREPFFFSDPKGKSLIPESTSLIDTLSPEGALLTGKNTQITHPY